MYILLDLLIKINSVPVLYLDQKLLFNLSVFAFVIAIHGFVYEMSN